MTIFSMFFAGISGSSAADVAILSRTLAPEMKREGYEVIIARDGNEALAAIRATFPAVRTYAQMLASHHEKANQELAALMRAKGLESPAGLAADKATKLYRLSALRPSAEFDRGYVRVVGVEDHTASVALFEQAQRDVRDRDLRAWIDRTLPVLRTHLDSARALSSTLAG